MFKIIDSFLTASDLNDIDDLCKEKGFNYGWKSNMNVDAFHWNIRFGGSTSPQRTDINIKEEDVPKLIWNIWQKINLENDRRLTRVYVNGYTYGTEGAIHTDSNFEESKTHMMYINKEWKPAWAGETVFLKNNEIIGAILPKPGRFIEFPGNLPHAARSVSRLSGVLRKVLVFKSEPK